MPGTACQAPVRTDTDPHELSKTIKDLAKFHISLEQLKFPLSGSLYRTDSGDVELGPWVISQMASSEPPYFPGPFRSEQERILAELDSILHAIEAGARFTEDPISAYLAHLEMRDLVRNCDEMADESAFYVKHADDKCDHIMVDEDGHITGIIDWEW